MIKRDDAEQTNLPVSMAKNFPSVKNKTKPQKPKPYGAVLEDPICWNTKHE